MLVRTTALFKISEGSTRTALSRLVAAGEAVAERGGYRLVGRLVARQQRQVASRRADVRAWDGAWELATVDGDQRRTAADRAAVRSALVGLRLTELREGVWARPDNLDPDRSPDATAMVAAWCVRWRGARPDALPSAGTLWDLSGWATRAAGLRREMGSLLRSLEGSDHRSLAEGFVVSAAVLRHLQADPLLPEELLSRRWPGDALRADYDRFDAAYRRLLGAWFTAAS